MPSEYSFYGGPLDGLTLAFNGQVVSVRYSNDTVDGMYEYDRSIAEDHYALGWWSPSRK